MKSRLFVVVLLAAVVGFGGCGKDKKSSDCLITSFTVDAKAWTVDNTAGTIIGNYEKGTVIGNLNPVIVASDKAKVTPTTAQDFSNGKEVTYTVTAENGKATKSYKAKAVVSQTP